DSPKKAQLNFGIFDESGKPYKPITFKEFKDLSKKYDQGKGNVAYKDDMNTARILDTKRKFVEVAGNKVTFVDAPGWHTFGAGKLLPAAEYQLAELYMKFKVTAEGTDGKQKVAEFFRYQLGRVEDGKWIIKEGAKYSGNTKFPLEIK